MIGQPVMTAEGPAERVQWVARLPDTGVTVFVPGGTSKVIAYRVGLACDDEAVLQTPETAERRPRIGDYMLCPARSGGLCGRQRIGGGTHGHG